MDRWKYYDIIHQRHSVMNPVDETKLERLYDLLELKKGREGMWSVETAQQTGGQREGGGGGGYWREMPKVGVQLLHTALCP